MAATFWLLSLEYSGGKYSPGYGQQQMSSELFIR